MSTHRPHPIQGEWLGKQYDDPEGAVLFDECDRCDEHASHPFVSLDDTNLRTLGSISRVPLTNNERQASRAIHAQLDALERAGLVVRREP